ncbi:hypothetical protein PAXRUDRAFT_833247 [Paxillus rubicundulus Ve08.2h10]|uniref:DUF6534 domain-containing protein n=1 Tax=Paxillus rubicundulus Ve08.2h10 TaxID=930991 RepID=A0A0D0DPK5_9AGAM|nr:hypothetical protein PAXRUDRAFT_833247 [Paxillus rubicundulus Ve08.2h10]
MQGPLCGTLATAFLYGIFCMQTFHYARNYTEDRLFLKWVVAFLWILETVHLAFSIHFIEYYLIMNFDNPPALEYSIWSLGATFLVGYLGVWIVNLCFVWRIWKLSRQNGTCIFLIILTTIRTAIDLANCVFSFIHTSIPEFLSMSFPTMLAGWVLAAIADSLIAIVLCYHLRKCRSGMRRTEHIINRLLLYTINTGALAALFAIITMILYLALAGSLVFCGFDQIQSKLYGISLLASLNSRKATLAQARLAVPSMNNVSLRFLANNIGTNNMDTSEETSPPIGTTKDMQVDAPSDEESLQWAL